MQTNDRVDFSVKQRVFRHVGNDECQIGAIILCSKSIAFFHHVGFEIVPYYLYFLFADLGKVIMNNKGKIGFSAAEIQHGKRLFYFGKLVVENFYKAVYLPVFVVHTVDHFEIFCKHTKVYKGQHGHTLGKNVIFLLVLPLVLLLVYSLFYKTFDIAFAV